MRLGIEIEVKYVPCLCMCTVISCYIWIASFDSDISRGECSVHAAILSGECSVHSGISRGECSVHAANFEWGILCTLISHVGNVLYMLLILSGVCSVHSDISRGECSVHAAMLSGECSVPSRGECSVHAATFEWVTFRAL